MSDNVAVTGMVIGITHFNDYDRRVVLLTKERGKITAFAQGARRQNSQLLARTQLFAFGTFIVSEGKNAYKLHSAEIMNYFESISKDPAKLCYASYFLEMASYYAKENNNEVELLKLVYQTLRIMVKDVIPLALIRAIYELRIFVVNGEYPECFHCVRCQSKENLLHFSPLRSGVLCNDCLSEPGQLFYVSPSTLYTMQYIIASSIERLYTFNVSEDVLHELQRVTMHYIDEKIDRPFKSMDVLEFMEDFH